MRFRVALAALALLAGAPAAADDRRPLEILPEAAIGLALASDRTYSDDGNASTAKLGLGVRMALLHRTVALTVQATTVGLSRASLLGGAGLHTQVGRWEALFLGMAGVHAFETYDSGAGVKGHKFPAAAVRASFYRPMSRTALSSLYGVSGELVADLRREHDPVVARRVGGVTALLTVSVGLAQLLW